jgi:hypothetical protein
MNRTTVSAAGGAMPQVAATPIFNNDLLIDGNGSIDHAFIQVSARARANSRYGVDCTERDVAYWAEKLTGMAEMLAAKFREAAAKQPIAPVVESVRVAARHLIPGDLIGSGERILSVSAGIRTRRGKLEVTLEKGGHRRMSLWGASTVINVRRAAQ